LESLAHQQRNLLSFQFIMQSLNTILQNQSIRSSQVERVDLRNSRQSRIVGKRAEKRLSGPASRSIPDNKDLLYFHLLFIETL
jgi:hypothetical protein